MALTCPIDFDVTTLRTEVQSMYARVAASPEGEFHFHRGPQYATERLGYDPAELAALPADVVASFAGVGNPHAIAPIERGAVVLDSDAAPAPTCCWPRGTSDPGAARSALT